MSSLSNNQNLDHRRKLMDAAKFVCRSKGRYRVWCHRKELVPSEFGGNMDIEYYNTVTYSYEDEKIAIRTDNREDPKDRYNSVHIFVKIRPSREEVFYVSGERILVYRPGKWEQYLLSMPEEIELDRKRISAQYQKECEKREAMKFSPIDDSDLF